MSYTQFLGAEFLNGRSRAAFRAASISVSIGSWTPVVSIRPKTAVASLIIFDLVHSVSADAVNEAPWSWGLFLNPTIGGTDAASWVDLNNSNAQYDVSRTNLNTITAGTLLAAGSLGANNTSNQVSPSSFPYISVAEPIALGVAPSTKNQIVLAAYADSTVNFRGALNWREKL